VESILQWAAALPSEVLVVAGALAVIKFGVKVFGRPTRTVPTRRDRPVFERRTPRAVTSTPAQRYSGPGPDWSSIVKRRPLPDGIGTVRTVAGTRSAGSGTA
jgi:hypothetical protein